MKAADPGHLDARGSFDASGKSAHLKIQDPGLGVMQWNLRMEGGRLAAEAIVQSARVQDMVQSNQEGLQARLNELGVELEGFEVSVDQGSHGFFGRGVPKGTVPPAQQQDGLPDAGLEAGGEGKPAGGYTRTQGVDLYA